MRYVSTRGRTPAVSFRTALFEGLAPDGGLYVPASIDPWPGGEIARLPSTPLVELGVRTLQPFVGDELTAARLTDIVADALDFPIPLVELERGIHALELFHGPTLAFKDVGARVMARLIAALHDGGGPVTILVATSGDTGSAVANAFHRVVNTRVVILYPFGRVSPTQEAQLAMFNEPSGESNVTAYALAGTFDDCHRLAREAFADHGLRERARLTSANSINIGRLLPQMIPYFHGVAQLQARLSQAQRAAPGEIVVSVPSGNFGNLMAGLMAKRAGLPVSRFVAATTVNDVVPVYLKTGRFEPRRSVATLANAMDVGNPGNFDRISWLYGGNLAAMRRDIVGSRHDDDEVRTAIRRVYERCGYVLDPHSAIACLGLAAVLPAWERADSVVSAQDVPGRAAIVLATAHPAKFAEIVEPIVGRPIDPPPSLADALGAARRIFRLDASLDAVKEIVDGRRP
jgi:threonine synthase